MSDPERKLLNDLDRMVIRLKTTLDGAFSAAINEWPEFPYEGQNEIGARKPELFHELARNLTELSMAVTPEVLAFLWEGGTPCKKP